MKIFEIAKITGFTNEYPVNKVFMKRLEYLPEGTGKINRRLKLT
jgi:hypothetical protein